MATSQALQDIFGIWDTRPQMAQEIGANPEQVRGWERTGRIPEDWWLPVISGAAGRGKTLCVTDLLAANRPPKQRGKPAHKIKPFRRRRAEARA